MKEFTLDPDDNLDFAINFNAPASRDNPEGPWLAEDETITSYTVTGTDGIAIHDKTQADGKVTFWATDAVEPVQYVTVHIVTSVGRETDRTVRFNVEQR